MSDVPTGTRRKRMREEKGGPRARVCVWSTLAFKVHSGGESANRQHRGHAGNGPHLWILNTIDDKTGKVLISFFVFPLQMMNFLFML